MTGAGAVDLGYPFDGRWMIRNSPAHRVPSHGTTLFASSHAIDFVPVDDAGRTAPVTWRSLTRPEAPERFPGFGRAIRSPADGVVVAEHDGLDDHRAYRGLPSLGYVLGQGRRAAAGWVELAGNHVAIDTGRAVVFLCHLRRGTVRVGLGQDVRRGQLLAECGNSGNSTEPHLHLQVVDALPVERANAVPMTFHGSLPTNGQIVDVPDGR